MVLLLVQPVIIGLAVLAPYESIRSTGALTLVASLGAWLLVTRLVLKGRQVARHRPTIEFVGRVALAELATTLAVAGAVCLLASSTAGFALLALSAAMCIAVGILDAWILLVEILR